MTTTPAQPALTAEAVNVKALLTLDALRDATVLAGAEGLHRPVVRAVALGAPGQIDERLAGAAIVFARQTLRAESYELEVALRRADASGASAIVVAEPPRPILQSTARLADKLELPLLATTAGDEIRIASELTNFVTQPEIVQLVALEKLVRQMGGSATPVDLVTTLAEALSHEVALLADNGALLAGAVVPEATDLVRRGKSDPAWAAVGDQTVVAVPVHSGPSLRHWLVAECDSVGPGYRRAIIRVLDIAGWVVAAHLAEQRLASERDARFRASLLTELVSAPGPVGSETIERAAVAGWDMSGWHSGAHISIDGRPEPETLHPLTEHTSHLLAEVGLEGPLVEHAEGWSFWTTSDTEPPVASYKQTVTALRRALARLGPVLGAGQVSAGVGRPSHGPKGLGISLAEAREAALLARATQASVSVVHFDALGTRRLLVGWYSSDASLELARSLLEPLLEHDPSGALVHTLECYFDLESSVTDTAATLGVHRNTVVNRMRRIHRLLDLNWKDPEERLALQLACKVARIGAADARSGRPTPDVQSA